MIIGIDHLQFSVDVLEESIAYLEEMGYRTVFAENEFMVDGRKCSFLREGNKSMAYLKRPQSISIELINRSSSAEGRLPSLLVPVFSGRIQGKRIEGGFEGTLLECYGTGELVRAEPLNADCLSLDDGEDEGFLNSLIVKTHDSEGSKKFWMQGLGFGEEGDRASESYFSVAFPETPFSARLKLTFVENKDDLEISAYVDDLGCSLVSFLSTDIEADVRRLCKFDKTKSSGVYSLEIATRKILACMVYGPGGEIVELIQVHKLGAHGESP